MLSLGLGLIAACVWAVHDFLVRKIGQEMAILPMMVVVLASGLLAMSLPFAALADWQNFSAAAFGFAAAAGLAYVIGMGGLYRAFSMAPVRLVAPILGAFPMISLGFAALGGKAVTAVEVLAVCAIVAGIAVVALTSRDGEATTRPGAAILWAAAGSLGFATTFWFAQMSAQLGDGMIGILVTRLVALVVVLTLALLAGAQLRRLNGAGRILGMMGVMDAIGISLVTLSAQLPNPEYAAIASSLFGVLTILLAWRILKESVAPLQWAGIATVFVGIAVLSAQD